LDKQLYWSGVVPPIDDFGKPIVDVFYDAKTRMGPWAYLAPQSFKLYGVGTGTGLGQKYAKMADGRWLKTEG